MIVDLTREEALDLLKKCMKEVRIMDVCVNRIRDNFKMSNYRWFKFMIFGRSI